jgi:CRISPR-associated protein Cmr2
MSEKYLISIAIGPVQDFIASARRSRDLWFGSWLLSELSKVVAKEIGKENLIFPAINKDSQLEENSEFNVVNKILAIAEISDEKAFDAKLRNIIKTRLERIYKDNGTNKGIFDEIDRKLGKDKSFFYRNEAEAQIKDLTEFYWAAIPYDETKYDECREKVEILLNARKATRDFKQTTRINSGKENAWASNAPKSSLDGQRESVIDDTKIGSIKIQRIFNLRKTERLCGVGVLKRLAEKKSTQSFASTSHMASLPLLATLENNENHIQAVKDYIEKLTDLIFQIEDKDLGKIPQYLEHPVFGKYDGHLLFENRLADLPFENKDKEKEAKNALKIFMKASFGDENKKPSPYFALLQADGDRMGTVIDNQKTPADHKKLSKALSKFAEDVKAIVEKKENNGCLIYSGGDDVLALLPLHTVLDCSRELTDKFADDLKKFEFTKDGENIRPTLSVGIAVVHHTEPLQDSLTTMRNAEKEAKSVDGKNALAITLSKRSGADTTIKGSWADDRKTGKSFDERLKWFIQLHLDDALPDGVAYELRDLWLRFSSVPSLKTAMEADAVRILSRKKSNQGLSKVSKDILGKLENLILNKDLSLEDLANEIIIARDFKNAYKQANKQAVGETK